MGQHYSAECGVGTRYQRTCRCGNGTIAAGLSLAGDANRGADVKHMSIRMKWIRTGFNGCIFLIPFILAGCASACCASAASNGDSVRDAGMSIHVFPDEASWSLQARAIDDSTYSIRVIDENGNSVQTIGDLVSRPPFTTKDLLDIRDYNADGHPDILARTMPVSASAITGGVLYIFKPAARQFVESEGIEPEGDITVEPDGCISVEYRSDAMNYRKDHYCWKDSRWVSQQTIKD